MCSIIFKNKDLNQSTHKTLLDIIEIKKKKKKSQNHAQSQILES